MNEIENSIVKSEGEAEIIVRDEGCDDAISLIDTTYANKLIEIRKFLVEEDLFD